LSGEGTSTGKYENHREPTALGACARNTAFYATLCLIWTPRRALLFSNKEHLQIVGAIIESAQVNQQQNALPHI
jgi:hypothetical protein